MNASSPSRRLRTGLLSFIGAVALLPAIAIAPATADEPQPDTSDPAATPVVTGADEPRDERSTSSSRS